MPASGDPAEEPAAEPVPLAIGPIGSPSESQFVSAAAIGARAARGGMLLILRNGLLQGLQVVSSIVLAKAIDPNGYGAFAVAATLVGLARSVGDLGLSQSLVVHARIEERDLSTGTAVALASAVATGAVVGLVGLLVNAKLLSHAGPAGLSAALAGSLVIEALRLGPIVRLTRALRFKEIALATTAEFVALYVVQVVLLLAGFGLWSLILAQYARALASLVVYRRLGGALARPRWGRRLRHLVADALPYQGPLVLGGLVGAVFPLIVAAGLDSRGLGLWAWSTILAIPIAALLLTLHGVLVPSMARLHDQYEERFSHAADRSARLIALAAGAGAASLIGLAPSIVEQIFGSRWVDATGAVQVTLLGLFPLAMSHPLSAAMQVRGQARPRLKCALVAAVATLVVVYPLIRLAGVTGAALASAVVGPTVDVLLLARIAAIPLRRAVYDGLLAMAAIGGASFLLGYEVHTAPGLVAASLATVAVALASIWAIDRTVVRDAWSLLRSGSTGS